VAVIRRDVSRIRDAAVVRSPSFVAFGRQFDALVFEFAEPIDVGAFADCLEDMPSAVAALTVSADGRSAEATVPGVPGRIVVERTALTVRGRGKDAGGLVDLLLAFLAAVGPVGDTGRALVPSPLAGEGLVGGERSPPPYPSPARGEGTNALTPRFRREQ
jgi:hypothetical protein